MAADDLIFPMIFVALFLVLLVVIGIVMSALLSLRVKWDTSSVTQAIRLELNERLHGVNMAIQRIKWENR